MAPTYTADELSGCCSSTCSARFNIRRAVVATPYDWAPNATPLGNWFGGHSQRAPHEGRGETILRSVVANPQVGFAITREHDRVTWRLPIAERSTMEYQVHLLELARMARPTSA